jgi:hypothetical protein
VVVDNSRGADPAFAGDLVQAFEAAGFEVELRQPPPATMYDTAVHFVVEGTAVRVPDDVAPEDLVRVTEVVRVIESRRRTERRRTRAVPVYRGESRRVIAWVDQYGTDELGA